MVHIQNQKRHGFSLTELAIVLGVMGILGGAIWGYAATARQSARLEQAREMVSLTVDAIRSAHSGQPTVNGGVSILVPKLIAMNAMPNWMLRGSTSTCGGVLGNYADTPWAAPAGDPCGTLHLCQWILGTNTACGVPLTPIPSQFFAIEFTQLSFANCETLVETMSPTSPAGMADVVINGTSAIGAGKTLPISPATAASYCTLVVPATVDFIYKLRTPAS